MVERINKERFARSVIYGDFSLYLYEEGKGISFRWLVGWMRVGRLVGKEVDDC